MWHIILYVALIILVIVAVAMHSWEPLISAGPPEFVLFYKEDCPYCEVMLPEWDKMKAANKSCAIISKINVAEQPQYASLRGVPVAAVPSIYYFPYGQYRSFEQYNGERMAMPMLKWLYSRLNSMGICNSVILGWDV